MTELIILPLLKALPWVVLRQNAPVSQEEAVAWGEKYNVEKVFYWPETKGAFIQVSAISARTDPAVRLERSKGDRQ